MATHSSILAWRIPQAEEPGGLQSMGSTVQRVGHDRVHRQYVETLLSGFSPWDCFLASQSCSYQGLGKLLRSFAPP